MTHRAYGWAHQKVRKRLLTTHLGLPCPRCGELMLDPKAPPYRELDLGHTDPASKLAGLPGDRLEHADCNRAAGDGTRTEYVPEWSSREW